jgi:PAS domain S-box-containing protein
MARRLELDKDKLESQDKDSRSSLPINVLLIEDSPADVHMVQEMLAESDSVKFNLEHADRLSSGLKLIADKEFDLVLLDLKLPDSCGFETFEKVEARIPETPIVVLTVFGEESVVAQALQAGAEDYLIKDRIDSDVLIRSIRYSIERKRTEMALRKANDELEMKVQERTGELVRANEALQAEITERKQAEKALQETQERFASFMRHLPGAAWIKDVQGHYVYANKVAEKIFNTTLGELLGRTDDQIFPADTAGQFRENDRHVIESGQNLQTIETLLQDDGVLHHSVVSKFPIFDRNGALTMVGGVAIDITGWKRAEEKLTLYREIFDKSTDGIAIIDPKGYYIEQNRAHRALVGYGDEELDGKTPAIHLGEEVFSKIGQELAETGRYRGEVISHTKMGTSVPIELSAFTVRDEKDETICYVGVKRDITERKQAEEQIRRSLSEKEVLLKEIHHRVKNNLQIISSLLNLQSRNITGKKAREKFKESQNRVKSMALIHEKLYQSGNLEGIYLQEYIHNLLKYLFSSYGVDTSKIKLKINAHNMLLSLDKAIPCGLIVNEIVSNSLKYSFPRGVQGEVYVDLRPDGDNYLLIVGNNGIPFPEDVNFRKTKSLGLQLVCALVEQLRGTIELNRSRGAEFRITFSP